MIPLVHLLTAEDVRNLEAAYGRATVSVLPAFGGVAISGFDVDALSFECGARIAAGRGGAEDAEVIYRIKVGALGKENFQGRQYLPYICAADTLSRLAEMAAIEDDAEAIIAMSEIRGLQTPAASWFRTSMTDGSSPVIDIHAAQGLVGWRATPKSDDPEGVRAFLDTVRRHADRIGVSVRALDRALFAAGSRYCPGGRETAQQIRIRCGHDGQR